MKSILQSDEYCYICGRNLPLEEHHIFGGSNRKHSDEDGLTVYLCHECHRTGKHAVHKDSEKMALLHEIGQTAAMQKYGWTVAEFRERYHKSYVTEEES